MGHVRRLASEQALAEALDLIDCGLSCFPCAASKCPTIPQGFKDATREPEVLREHWRQYPGPLIGVATGITSQLDVLDVDCRHHGESWFAKHRAELPPTRVHRTRGGGLHLLFQHCPGVRCSAGRIAPGIDVRAAGGYIIWWPAAGLPVLRDLPPAPWPERLLALLKPPPQAAAAQCVRVPDEHSLLRLVRLIAAARPGERNTLTFWAACRAGEMVASGLLRADTAAAVVAEAATRAGLSHAEAERTAWSGIRTSGGAAHA